jgi:magnesium transporter
MIKALVFRDGLWHPCEPQAAAAGGGEFWLDLAHPDPGEIAAVEALLGIAVPTRADMQEIELSSRLYQEGGSRFMTAMVLSAPGDDNLLSSAVSFVLGLRFLLTLRYHDPRPFEAFAARLERPGSGCGTALEVLIGLLEAIIDRMADILEYHSAEIERTSRLIFNAGKKPSAKLDLHATIREIGTEGDHISMMRESLASVSRVAIFLGQAVPAAPEGGEPRGRLRVLVQDVSSLADYAAFMANKVTFLLDATLGMINIQQNNIIKIVSVVAVVFLPPTLIASIYGMNFKFIPELEWELGYLLAVALMVVSAILPYAYFKRKNWL